MSTRSIPQLVLHQFRYDQKTFWRQPESVFFTVVLPIIFLFIFVSIFGNDDTSVGGGRTVKGSTYYLPGIVALGIISATFFNLSISLAIERERGTLKRVRSTPLPPWVFMAARIATATVVSLLLVVTVTLLGRIVYGVSVPTNTLPGLVLTVLLGTASFCALGFALASFIPSESAAPAVVNAVTLPLYFFSGIFIPGVPGWMDAVASVFPVKHVFDALLNAFDPTTAGNGIEWGNLAVLAAWGLIGLVIALRRFRWTPRSG